MISVADITRRYVGRPYDEQTCAGLLYQVLHNELAIDVPESLGELSLANYMEDFKARPKWVQSQFVRHIREVGEYADPRHPQLWDILIVHSGFEKCIFPALALEMGKAMFSTLEYGVHVWTLNRWLRPIMARRVT